MPYKALTIAGSDSGGGAGIQADLKTFAARGVYGMSVITAVTAQNTLGVQGVYDMSPDAVVRQLDAVLSDIGADAIKTGMLSRASLIEVVADQLKLYKKIPVVVDPVMVAKSGDALLDPAAVSTLIERLLPLATVVTPNLHEVNTLTGLEIHDVEDMKTAAQRIRDMGASCVVVKGGHFEGRAIDVLYDGEVYETFDVDRIETEHTHGTGCTFASAIAAELAKGHDVHTAVGYAKAYLTDAIRHAEPVGRGHGPVHHFYTLYQEAEKQSVLEALASAARRLEYADAGVIVPEVQSNLGMGLPGARSLAEVAAFPGRLVRLRRGIRTVAPPEFGASSHIGRIVLTVMRHDPAKRAVMNIRYSDEIIAVCRSLDLHIASFDRKQEPRDVKEKEGGSLEWGTGQAIQMAGAVPDIIYDLGDIGKEPMARIIGKDPAAVVDIALRIAERVRGSQER